MLLPWWFVGLPLDILISQISVPVALTFSWHYNNLHWRTATTMLRHSGGNKFESWPGYWIPSLEIFRTFLILSRSVAPSNRPWLPPFISMSTIHGNFPTHFMLYNFCSWHSIIKWPTNLSIIHWGNNNQNLVMTWWLDGTMVLKQKFNVGLLMGKNCHCWFSVKLNTTC